MKKIYLFGASGWAGKSIADELINNSDCKLYQYDKSVYSEKVMQIDVSNEKSVSKALKNLTDEDVVISTVGIVHPKLFVKDFYRVNFNSNRILIKTALEIAPNIKIIFLSSNSPFGFNKGQIFDENSNYNPYMHYGKSKMMIEEWIIKNVKNHTIFRVPWFQGPNMPQRQIMFYDKVSQNKFPVFGKGNNLRSIVNVQTIAKAINSEINYTDQSNKVLWLCDETKSQLEINKIIFENYKPSKLKFKPKHIPSLLCKVARIADYCIQKVGLYNKEFHVLGEMDQDIYCSNSKLLSTYNNVNEVKLETFLKTIK